MGITNALSRARLSTMMHYDSFLSLDRHIPVGGGGSSPTRQVHASNRPTSVIHTQAGDVETMNTQNSGSRIEAADCVEFLYVMQPLYGLHIYIPLKYYINT